MEYIGLLGLLGLIGFFVSSGLENKFDNLKKSLPDTESRIAQDEKIIADLQKEIERLNFILQNYVTQGDLNNFSYSLQQQIQKDFQAALKNYATISGVKELERKIDSLPQIPDLQSLQQKISALEIQISEQNKILAQFSQQLDEQKNLNAAYEKRIKQLENKIGDTTPPPVPELTIKNFQLQKNNQPLFTNSAAADKVLTTIENLSEIISFLKNSKFNKKDNFIRLIKNYQNNIQKFADKVRRGKFDEENFSEEVSNAFFDVLKKYFLATLPVSIYRGKNENLEFYSEFLSKVNKYLAACHVYTEFIEPKKIMQRSDLEKMEIVKKDTAQKTEDKLIDEVERLPYFLDYLTDDEEIERCNFDGAMIVLQFNGGTK